MFTLQKVLATVAIIAIAVSGVYSHSRAKASLTIAQRTHNAEQQSKKFARRIYGVEALSVYCSTTTVSACIQSFGRNDVGFHCTISVRNVGRERLCCDSDGVSANAGCYSD